MPLRLEDKGLETISEGFLGTRMGAVISNHLQSRSQVEVKSHLEHAGNASLRDVLRSDQGGLHIVT